MDKEPFLFGAKYINTTPPRIRTTIPRDVLDLGRAVEGYLRKLEVPVTGFRKSEYLDEHWSVSVGALKWTIPFTVCLNATEFQIAHGEPASPSRYARKSWKILVQAAHDSASERIFRHIDAYLRRSDC